MPASLISLIGPDIDPTVVAAFSATTSVGPVEEVTGPHVAALPGLNVQQWLSDMPRTRLQTALAEFVTFARKRGVDVLITPAELLSPGPRLIVTDVDSTLIRDEVIELLADHAGSRELVTRVTEEAMRGELDFTESLIQRVATLRGLDVSAHDAVSESLRLSEGVENLCRVLKKNGDFIGVVSGGFIEIVGPLAQRLNIDFARANELEVEESKLTGQVTGTIVDRDVKAQTLRNWAQECDVPLERTIAIGDGANDLAMLATAGLGVAFNAKPVVQEQADAAITGPRLDAILAVIGN